MKEFSRELSINKLTDIANNIAFKLTYFCIKRVRNADENEKPDNTNSKTGQEIS